LHQIHVPRETTIALTTLFIVVFVYGRFCCRATVDPPVARLAIASTHAPGFSVASTVTIKWNFYDHYFRDVRTFKKKFMLVVREVRMVGGRWSSL
jgi:hypothetical protein